MYFTVCEVKHGRHVIIAKPVLIIISRCGALLSTGGNIAQIRKGTPLGG